MHSKRHNVVDLPDYESLTDSMKVELVNGDPERALRFINVFGDKKMAQKYVTVYPESSSAYHVARKFGIEINGSSVKQRVSDPGPFPECPASLSFDGVYRDRMKKIRALVASVNHFNSTGSYGCGGWSSEGDNGSWENVVRAYEDNRWVISKR